MTDPSDLLTNLTNTTNLQTNFPSDLPSWSFSAHIMERLHESGGLFIALAPALISNILFQASDNVLMKRVLSFVMGILIQGFLFHLSNIAQYRVLFCPAAVHSLIIAFVVYLLTRLFKQKSPAIVIIFVLSYALTYHKSFEQSGSSAYSVWKDLYKFSLIPLFCKCISFAYCYADSFKHPNDLSLDQNKRKITQFPSILNYFSYMFHYLSAFFGPPIDYYDFINFTAATEEYKNYDKNLKGTFFNVLFASAAFFAYIILTCFVDITAIFTKGLPVDSSVIYEIYLICALGLISRLLYYSVAVASQASIELSGLSYSGMDENWKSYFGRIKVINPSYMFENNITTIIEGWSPSYYVWMKRYIYVRVLPLEIIRKNMLSKALALAVSLGVTFILFGIPLPGVISYGHLFLMILVATYLYRGQWRIRNYPVWLRSIGNILKWSYMYFAVSVFVAGIQINDWNIALGIYKRVGYIPVVIELALLGYFFLMGWNKREEIKGKDQKKDVNEAIISDETSEYLHAIDRKKEHERFEWLKTKKDK